MCVCVGVGVCMRASVHACVLCVLHTFIHVCMCEYDSPDLPHYFLVKNLLVTILKQFSQAGLCNDSSLPCVVPVHVLYFWENCILISYPSKTFRLFVFGAVTLYTVHTPCSSPLSRT